MQLEDYNSITSILLNDIIIANQIFESNNSLKAEYDKFSDHFTFILKNILSSLTMVIATPETRILIKNLEIKWDELTNLLKNQINIISPYINKKQHHQAANFFIYILQGLLNRLNPKPSIEQKINEEIKEKLFTQALGSVSILKSELTINIFISYAWGVPEHEQITHKIAEQLQQAGIEVLLDVSMNNAGAYVSYFTEKIKTVDYVVLIGSKNLLAKYNEGVKLFEELQALRNTKRADNEINITPKPEKIGRIVVQELRQIFVKANISPGSIIPILLDGEMKECLPPNLGDLVPITLIQYRDRTEYRKQLFSLLKCLLPAFRKEISEIENNYNFIITNGFNFSPQEIKNYTDIIQQQNMQEKGEAANIIRNTLDEIINKRTCVSVQASKNSNLTLFSPKSDQPQVQTLKEQLVANPTTSNVHPESSSQSFKYNFGKHTQVTIIEQNHGTVAITQSPADENHLPLKKNP